MMFFCNNTYIALPLSLLSRLETNKGCIFGRTFKSNTNLIHVNTAKIIESSLNNDKFENLNQLNDLLNCFNLLI